MLIEVWEFILMMAMWAMICGITFFVIIGCLAYTQYHQTKENDEEDRDDDPHIHND